MNRKSVVLKVLVENTRELWVDRRIQNKYQETGW
jgi:hypothetical protein